MGLIGIGFFLGIIASVAVIALCKTEQGEPRKKEITTEEMKQVINYYYHFGRATSYEKEVMEALMAKLEEDMQCEKERISEEEGEARIIRLANKLGIKIEGVR